MFRQKARLPIFFLPTKYGKLTVVHCLNSDFATKRAWGPKGERVILIKPGVLPPACSLTLLTTLGGDSMFHWTTRIGSNTQADFLKTVEQFVQGGVLRRGMVLVMDNARVHTGDVDGGQERLNRILSDAGIQLMYLPTYSPELNPCEFVFARFKFFLKSSEVIARHQAIGAWVDRGLDDLFCEAVSRISRESMEATYRHCREIDPNAKMAACLRERGFLDD